MENQLTFHIDLWSVGHLMLIAQQDFFHSCKQEMWNNKIIFRRNEICFRNKSFKSKNFDNVPSDISRELKPVKNKNQSITHITWLLVLIEKTNINLRVISADFIRYWKKCCSKECMSRENILLIFIVGLLKKWG